MRQTKVSGIQVPRMPQEVQEVPISVSDIVNQGMFPDSNPTKIPESGLSLAKNAIIRDGKTSRAPGTTLYSIAKPNASKILHLTNHVDATKTVRLLRHTKSSVHYATASSWNNVTITPALAGTDNDQIRSVQADYRYFFTNNGVDQIQEVNFGANTCAPVTAFAPKVKRIFAFNNRIIGVNVRAGAFIYTQNDPTLVVWSGLDNYSEYDYTIDISAGFKRLVESPSDTNDFLVDGLGFDTVGLIIRERSIWVISPQPIATEPFSFYPAIPNRGCSCDYGVAKIENGIVFPDLNAKDVFVVTIDDNITNRQSFKLDRIGGPIKRHLFNSIQDPTKVFTGYNPAEQEVSICILDDTTFVTKQWTFSFAEKGWTYREYDSVSCIGDLISITSGATIDELTGTIDDLIGTIDGLSGVGAAVPNRLLGRTDGEILVINDDVINDSVISHTESNFEMDLRSKLIEIPAEDIDVSCSYFPIKPYTTGTITIWYSRDGGTNWVFSKACPIITDNLNKRIIIKFKKILHTESLMWRLTSTDVRFDLLGYDVVGTTGGEQK